MSGAATLTFRPALQAEAAAVAALVNSAYRGDTSSQGWTTEAGLLDGRRIDEAGVAALIREKDSMLLLCFDEDVLVGSVLLQRSAPAIGYLGMFVIRPDRQGAGLGRRFMREAEQTAQRLWGVQRMTMSVISLRRELIAYYERRGYCLTGEILPFPFEDGLSAAKVAGIELAVMEKPL